MSKSEESWNPSNELERVNEIEAKQQEKEIRHRKISLGCWFATVPQILTQLVCVILDYERNLTFEEEKQDEKKRTLELYHIIDAFQTDDSAPGVAYYHRDNQISCSVSAHTEKYTKKSSV
jgi:hypothetical protein